MFLKKLNHCRWKNISPFHIQVSLDLPMKYKFFMEYFWCNLFSRNLILNTLLSWILSNVFYQCVVTDSSHKYVHELIKQVYLQWFCELTRYHKVCRKINDAELSFFHPTLYKEIYDVDVPGVDCTRDSSIYIHCHCTLIVLEKPFLFI